LAIADDKQGRTGEEQAPAQPQSDRADATPQPEPLPGAAPDLLEALDAATMEAARLAGEPGAEDDALAEAEAGAAEDDAESYDGPPAELGEPEPEPPPAPLSAEDARLALEAVLFVADKALTLEQLAAALKLPREETAAALETVRTKYGEGSGVRLVEVAGAHQLRTAPAASGAVRRLLQIKPQRLTRAALEALAIVAYRQPVTRSEIEDIRGVDCGAVLKALLDRRLLRILGKKEEPGRPLLYGTTREFLELFSLRDLTGLPTLREFQELSEEHREIVETETPAPAGLALPLEAEPVQTSEGAEQHDEALAALEMAMKEAETRSRAAEEILDPPGPDAAEAAEPDGAASGTAAAGASGSPAASGTGAGGQGGEAG
jgi:segregation and condensation protein B